MKYLQLFGIQLEKFFARLEQEAKERRANEAQRAKQACLQQAYDLNYGVLANLLTDAISNISDSTNLVTPRYPLQLLFKPQPVLVSGSGNVIYRFRAARKASTPISASFASRTEDKLQCELDILTSMAGLKPIKVKIAFTNEDTAMIDVLILR